jgi:hypothetical protein
LNRQLTSPDKIVRECVIMISFVIFTDRIIRYQHQEGESGIFIHTYEIQARSLM